LSPCVYYRVPAYADTPPNKSPPGYSRDGLPVVKHRQLARQVGVLGALCLRARWTLRSRHAATFVGSRRQLAAALVDLVNNSPCSHSSSPSFEEESRPVLLRSTPDAGFSASTTTDRCGTCTGTCQGTQAL